MIRQIRQPSRDPECRACAASQFRVSQRHPDARLSVCAAGTPFRFTNGCAPSILPHLRRSLEPLGDVRANEFALRFFPCPYEMTVFPDGRAIIKGTTDIGVARSLYARYVGS